MKHADLPGIAPDLAVELALAEELIGLSKAPRSASVQTRTSTAPPVTALSILADDLQGAARVFLGVCDLTGAQVELSRVPGRRRTQPQRAALGCLARDHLDRRPRVVEAVGHRQHADAQVARQAAPRVGEQLTFPQCFQRERRAGARIWCAELARQPGAMGQHRSPL